MRSSASNSSRCLLEIARAPVFFRASSNSFDRAAAMIARRDSSLFRASARSSMISSRSSSFNDARRARSAASPIKSDPYPSSKSSSSASSSELPAAARTSKSSSSRASSSDAIARRASKVASRRVVTRNAGTSRAGIPNPEHANTRAAHNIDARSSIGVGSIVFSEFPVCSVHRTLSTKVLWPNG